MIRRGVTLALLGLAMGAPSGGGNMPLGTASLAAQERVYHPFHLPASHNWVFRAQHPAADRLFNGFDFGHGVLYETLWSQPEAPVSLLEEEIYHQLTREVLPNPPRLPMPEASFMPQYARLVPRAKGMFEWAHILHRQSYDVLADPDLTEEERDAAMGELLAFYRSSDLAFPVEPKGMEIMDEQYFSKAFRDRYPRFNGLIWAYHWLQVAVYEPLLAFDDPEEQQVGVQAALVRFWQMLEDPPATLPSEMPMTPAIAPIFTQRYPEFAAIFDNLHMMHDVISDILVSQAVERGEKRAEIYRQTDLFRDPQVMATSVDAWKAMALAHGGDAQGGPAIHWLPEVPTRGAEGDHSAHEGHTMASGEMDHGDMDHGGMDHGEMDHGDMDHGAMDHGGMDHGDMDHGGMDHGAMHQQHMAAMDSAVILGVVRDFHQALAQGDSASALELLHPEVLIHEQGGAEDLDQYRAQHLPADMRFAAAVTREVLEEELSIHATVALYTAQVRSRGRLGDRDVDSHGVETVALTRTPDGWRIRHVHWSSR